MKPQNRFRLLGIVLFIFFLPACNSVAFTTPTAISATATLPSLGIKRIAFHAKGVYVINVDGTGLARLTGSGTNPSWSPDGHYIASVAYSIYLMNADGSDLKSITDTFDTDSPVAWSPDGRQIVFVSYSHAEEKLYVLDVGEILQGKPDTDPKPLTALGVTLIQGVTWSPNGQQIAFSYRRDLDSPYEIAIMNIEETLQGAEWGPWLGLTEGETPAWSPDGQHIAFMAYQGDYPGIEIMDANGDHQTRLANNATDPAWSPDGQRIAFVSARDGNYEIYVMDTDGSHQTRLTNNSAFDTHPAWSPDGEQIAFISGKDALSGNLYVMNADGSHLLRLTDASLPLWPQVPMWAPQ